jgi:glycoprotein endo-alpha-1,2-mannosidase
MKMATGRHLREKRPRKCAAMLAAAASLLLTIPGVGAEPHAEPLSVPRCPSTVAAFYYGWYGDQLRGWRHWANTDANFPHDPTRTLATGSQYPGGMERDIAANDYPLLGPYDSQGAVTDSPATPLDVSPADPYLTVDQHFAWAAGSGIDVLVSSWWGIGTYEDESLRILLSRIDAGRSPVRASAYLETWALFYGGSRSRWSRYCS